MHQTSERLHLAAEFCARCGTAAGQTSVAAAQAGGIISVTGTLLQHRQDETMRNKHYLEIIPETIHSSAVNDFPHEIRLNLMKRYFSKCSYSDVSLL